MLRSHAEGHLVFDADLDSGNLVRVERLAREGGEGPVYVLDVAPDACSSFRAWFHFSVRGAREGEELAFEVRGLANHGALFNTHGARPVSRAVPSRPAWERVRGGRRDLHRRRRDGGTRLHRRERRVGARRRLRGLHCDLDLRERDAQDKKE